MKLQITSYKNTPSKYGGFFYYVFFKDDAGKNYKSCIYPNCRNFNKWRSVLKRGSVLDNLVLKSAGLVDADSNFNFLGIKQSKPKPQQPKLF